MDLFKKIIAKNCFCPILSKIDLTNVLIPKTYCKIYFLECNALSSLTLKILCWYIPLCNGWLEITKRGSECGHYKEVRFRSQVLCNYVNLPLFKIPECNWVVQKLSSNVVQVWAPPFLKRSITKQHFHGMVGIETYGFKTAAVYVLSKKKKKKRKKKEKKIQRTKKGGNKNKNQKNICVKNALRKWREQTSLSTHLTFFTLYIAFENSHLSWILSPMGEEESGRFEPSHTVPQFSRFALKFRTQFWVCSYPNRWSILTNYGQIAPWLDRSFSIHFRL